MGLSSRTPWARGLAYVWMHIIVFLGLAQAGLVAALGSDLLTPHSVKVCGLWLLILQAVLSQLKTNPLPPLPAEGA